jgi:hypothetical protein
MQNLRSLIRFTVALALTAFMAPAFAAKTFDFAADASVATGIGKTVKVYLTNEDTGNSSFNSVRVTGTPGSGPTLTITGATQSGSAKPGTPVISPDGKSVTITDLSPIKGGKTLTVTLTVNVTAGTCSNGSIGWSGSAWTGSPSTPSNPFSTTDAPSTSVSAGPCGVTFDTEPKNALKGQLVTGTALDPTAARVKVSVQVNGGNAPDGTPVTLQSSCTTPGLSPASFSKTTTGGSAEFDNLTSTSTASGCTLTATSTALPSAYSDVSASFDVVDASLVISGLPTSFALNVTTPVTATLVTANNAPVPQSGGTGTLTISGACTPSTLSVSAVNGVLSFGNVSGSTVGGSCTLQAVVTLNGATFTSTSYGPYAVYKSSGLNCATTPPGSSSDPGYFAALPAGVTSVTDIGYAAGYRAANDKGNDCLLVNYTFTNNIVGGATTDGAGNTLPANAVSFVWDENFQANAVFTYTLTFAAEFVDTGTGLPAKKTKYCELDKVSGLPVPTDCTLATKQKDLKACVGAALTATSIPGADPACVAAEAWSTVAATECASLTNPNAPNPPPACIVVTARIIDARDPPIIR